MRKFFRIIYCMLICILVFRTSALASTGQAKIIKQNKEITDLNELIERVKKGETDLKTSNKPYFVIKNNDTKEEIKLSALCTIQLLSVAQTTNSNIYRKLI